MRNVTKRGAVVLNAWDAEKHGEICGTAS